MRIVCKKDFVSSGFVGADHFGNEFWKKGFPNRIWSDLTCWMKTYSRRKRRPARHVRIPAFLPVPLRARADGWTPKRQIAFIGALGATGSVLAAARRVSMARESAYRLRRKPGAESFAAAWDAALRKAGPARKVTSEERMRRATEPLFKPVLYAGEHVATVEKADNSALLALVSQLGRAKPSGPSPTGRSQSFAGASASTSAGFGMGAAPVSRWRTPPPSGSPRPHEAGPSRKTDR